MLLEVLVTELYTEVHLRIYGTLKMPTCAIEKGAFLCLLSDKEQEQMLSTPT